MSTPIKVPSSQVRRSHTDTSLKAVKTLQGMVSPKISPTSPSHLSPIRSPKIVLSPKVGTPRLEAQQVQLAVDNLFLTPQDRTFDSKFRALVMILHKKALVLIFQGKQLEGAVDPSRNLFLKNAIVEIRKIAVSNEFARHFSLGKESSFEHSAHFVAFRVRPTTEKSNSTPEEKIEALKGTTLSFFQGGCSFKRLNNYWEDKTGLPGLKFVIHRPFRMEFQIHPMEASPRNVQTQRLRENAEKMVQIKEKELVLNEIIQSLEAEIRARAQFKKESADIDLNLQVTALKRQKNLLEASGKNEVFQNEKLMKEPPAHASHVTAIRAFTEVQVKTSQATSEYLAIVLHQIAILTDRHFDAELRIINSRFSEDEQEKKLELHASWINFLGEQTASLENSEKVALSRATEALSNIRTIQVIRADLERSPLKNPSDALIKSYKEYLQTLDKEVESCEKLIDAFSLDSVCSYMQKNPTDKVVFYDSLSFLIARIVLNDRFLTLQGLVDPELQGAGRYLTSIEYAEKRASLDEQMQKLLLIYFFEMIEINPNDPLTKTLCQRLSSNLPTPLIMQLLKRNAPYLFDPFAENIKDVIAAYEEVEAAIKDQNLNGIQEKWAACKKAIADLVEKIPDTKVECVSTSDGVLQALLSNTNSQSNELTELRKIKRVFDDPIKVGDLAASLLSQPIRQSTTNLLKHLISTSYLFLREQLKEFPSLHVRNWIAKTNGTLASRRHLSWNRHCIDPLASTSETSLPI